MANYPNSVPNFGAERVDLVNSVVADDVNSLYREVLAIAQDLGAGDMGVGTPGLKFSSSWTAGGSFDISTTSWSSLQKRLQNIEKGVYQAYVNRLGVNGNSLYNKIQNTNAVDIGLIVKGGSLTGTVTAATSDGSILTYTANNSFTVGQKVTVTGITASSGNPSLNVSLKTITALVGSGPTFTGFSISSPTIGPTGITGSTSGSSNQLLIVGDISSVTSNMTIIGTNIAANTKVVAVSGQTITMSQNSTGTVSGGITFKIIGSESAQTGTATAYQTTSLQQWQKADSSIVASISAEGNFMAAGTGWIGGSLTVNGAITFGGAATINGNTSVSGTLTTSGAATVGGELIATVINGGTP